MGPVQFPVRLGRVVTTVCTGGTAGVAVVHPEARTAIMRRRMVNAVFIHLTISLRGLIKAAGLYQKPGAGGEKNAYATRIKRTLKKNNDRNFFII
jgi:hypothetical protein